MKKRIQFNKSHLTRVVLSGVFTLLIAPVASTLAGKIDFDTGNTCWGVDCADQSGSGSESADNNENDTIDTDTINTDASDTANNPLRLSNVETTDCGNLETNKIHIAVDWLQGNLNEVDKQMGRNGLMDWPGNSRENFEEKLDKKLKFHCINEKDKCGDLLGIVYPVFAQKRINLCTNSIRASADSSDRSRQSMYVHVVAHEIGHLIRLNKHRSKCTDMLNNPRFSQSVGFAAGHAYRGDTYNANNFSCISP